MQFWYNMYTVWMLSAVNTKKRNFTYYVRLTMTVLIFRALNIIRLYVVIYLTQQMISSQSRTYLPPKLCTFLQHTAMLCTVLAIAFLSMSVCLSITCQLCIKINEQRTMLSLLEVLQIASFKLEVQRESMNAISLAHLSVWVSECVCLDVNQGGTHCNRCTQRLVILHAQTYY